jgi:hypothetical protein
MGDTSNILLPLPPSTPTLIYRPDDTILVKDVRLSYEHLFKAWSKKPTETPKFSGTFMLPKATRMADVTSLAQRIMALSLHVLKAKVPADKRCLRDGDLAEKEEYVGYWTIKANELMKPKVIDAAKRPVTEADDKVYSGCYGNVLIRLWAQNNEHGKRVNANLLAFQVTRGGERFGGVARPNVDEVFDDESGSFVEEGAASGDDDPFA